MQVGDLKAEIDLIWSNAILFNSRASDVGQKAEHLERFTTKKFIQEGILDHMTISFPPSAASKLGNAQKRAVTPTAPPAAKRKSVSLPPAPPASTPRAAASKRSSTPVEVLPSDDQPMLPSAGLKITLNKCLKLLQPLMSEPNAHYFNAPVDPEALGLWDYTNIVKQPMDLGTIEKKLNAKTYDVRSVPISPCGLISLSPLGPRRPPLAFTTRLSFSPTRPLSLSPRHSCLAHTTACALFVFYVNTCSLPAHGKTLNPTLSFACSQDPGGFVDDVRLVFSNARLYNPADTEVAKAAVELSRTFEARLIATVNPSFAASPAPAPAAALPVAASPAPLPSPAVPTEPSPQVQPTPRSASQPLTTPPPAAPTPPPALAPAAPATSSARTPVPPPPAPPPPPPSAPPPLGPEGVFQRYHKIVRALRNHPAAQPFRAPLDWEKQCLFEYPQIVTNPMVRGSCAARPTL